MIKMKQLRIQKGLSQKELANSLGIAYKNYNTYELGRATPDIDTLIKIANYYHVSLDYLCGNEFHRIELGFLSEKKEAVVKAVKDLSDLQCDKVLSYICGMLDKTDDDYINN